MEDKVMDDSFVFYRSFFDALSVVPEEEYASCVKALLAYGLNGEDIAEGSYAKMLLALAKPVLDANQKRRENGKKGGRPKVKETETIGFVNEKPMVTDKKTIGYEDVKPNEDEDEDVNEDVNEDVDVHEERDEDGHADEEIYIPKSKAPRKRLPKHKHGEYQHILLSDEELQKLIENIGDRKTSQCIRYLDEYKERKGYKCKSDYLTILKWVVEAVDEEEKKKRPSTREPESRIAWIDDWGNT